MRKTVSRRSALTAVVLALGVAVASFAGDSVFGKVTEVRSADVVVLQGGGGTFVIHLLGVSVPEGATAAAAKKFVETLVLGKSARMRLGSRLPNGEVSGQLSTADPAAGIKDVGLELVRAGLAQRQAGEDYQFGYRYNELTKAESEAREARRGMWAANPPQ